MNIFTTLPVGDTVSWIDQPITLPDLRLATSAAWTLTYALRGAGSLDIVAVATGGGWKSTLGVTASAALGAGLYRWAAVLTSGAGDAAERITVGTGQLTLTANLGGVEGAFEARSIAQVALAACEAAMATFNRTGGKVRKYDIAGRSMEFQSIAELMQLHSFWAAKVLSEGTTASIANGDGNPRNLLTRFVRTI